MNELGDSRVSPQENESKPAEDGEFKPLSSEKNVGEKLHTLEKLVSDIANTDLLPSSEHILSGLAGDREGRSIVEKFLIHICPCIDDEIGPKIASLGRWRSDNLARIGHIASMKLLVELSQMRLVVHPRVMLAFIEKGSQTDNEFLIDMWANFLVASCSFDEDEERYISYAFFIENMTEAQAQLLDKLASSSVLDKTSKAYQPQKFTVSSLQELIGVENVADLLLDLTHLQSMRLVDLKWDSLSEDAFLRVTPVGMQLYQTAILDSSA